MPPPIAVELWPHSPAWELMSQQESARIAIALKHAVLTVHHIGSTAIPAIHAKPIIDLLPVVRSVSELDARQAAFEQLGYRYWSEYGIPGRRYCTRDETITGRRLFQLHCFAEGSDQIERHLAFRDYLRANRSKAQEYDAEKQRCRDLYPADSHAYSEAKAAWIEATLVEAREYYRART